MDCHSLLQGSLQPRDRTWVSRIAGRFFSTEIQGSWRRRLTENRTPVRDGEVLGSSHPGVLYSRGLPSSPNPRQPKPAEYLPYDRGGFRSSPRCADRLPLTSRGHTEMTQQLSLSTESAHCGRREQRSSVAECRTVNHAGIK